jgi:type IV secretory pathway VirB9-like protein
MKLTPLVALLFIADATAAHAESCDRRVITPADITTINVELNKTVHLVFPDPILQPVIGNTDEWEQFGQPAMPLHLWVLPRKTSSPTAQTSLTVVTAAGAYDFVLRRTEKDGSVCMHFGHDASIASMNFQAPAATVVSTTPQAVSLADYQWKGNTIDRVTDDGLYTYVTLAKVPRALPVILGEGAPVTTTYDASTRTFRIVGLFDEIAVVYGKKKRTQIKRAS